MYTHIHTFAHTCCVNRHCILPCRSCTRSWQIKGHESFFDWSLYMVKNRHHSPLLLHSPSTLPRHILPSTSVRSLHHPFSFTCLRPLPPTHPHPCHTTPRHTTKLSPTTDPSPTLVPPTHPPPPPTPHLPPSVQVSGAVAWPYILLTLHAIVAVVFAVGIRPGWSSFSLFVLHSSLHDRNEEVGGSGGRRSE